MVLVLLTPVLLLCNQCSDTLKNAKFTATLLDVVKEAGLSGGCPKAKGNLLYTVAIKVGCGWMRSG
jgi:hypothetical protein